MSCVLLTGPPVTLIETSTATITNVQTVTAAPSTIVTSTPVVTSVCPIPSPCVELLPLVPTCPPAQPCVTSTFFQPVTNVVAGAVATVTATSVSVQLVTQVSPGAVVTSCATPVSTTRTPRSTRTSSSTETTSSSTVESVTSTTPPVVLAPTTSPELTPTSSGETLSTITSYSTVIVTNIDGGLSTRTDVITKPTLLHGSGSGSSSKLGGGAIAGIVVGCLAGLLALLALLFLLRRKGFFGNNEDEQLGEDYWQPAPHGGAVLAANNDDDDDHSGESSGGLVLGKGSISNGGGGGGVMREKSMGSLASQRYRQSWYQDETTSDVPYNSDRNTTLSRRDTKLTRRSSFGNALDNPATTSPPLSPSAAAFASTDVRRLSTRKSLSRLDEMGAKLSYGGHAHQGSVASQASAYVAGNVQSLPRGPRSAASDHSSGGHTSAAHQGSAYAYSYAGHGHAPLPLSHAPPVTSAARPKLSVSPTAASSSEGSAYSAGPYSAASFFNSLYGQSGLPTPASTQVPSPGISGEDESELLSPPKRPPAVTRTYSGDSLVMPSQFLGARIANADAPDMTKGATPTPIAAVA